MKKRRTLIISLLLVAALMLGIGYAALARDMTISSTANLNPDNGDFAVVFTNAVVESGKEALATASVTGDHSTANYTITGLSAPGESVTLTFTLENQTADIDAKLTGITSTPGTLTIASEGNQIPANVNEWFTKEVVITTYDENSTPTEYTVGTDDITTIELLPGDIATVTITVTLTQTVTDPVTLTGAAVMLSWNGTKTA